MCVVLLILTSHMYCKCIYVEVETTIEKSEEFITVWMSFVLLVELKYD